jgi:cytochrome c
MKRARLHSLWALPALLACQVAATVCAQDADAGKAVFAQCAACHSIDGTTSAGPTLKGVIGRKAGSLPGFRYSRALKSAPVVWDASSVDAYIAEPQKFIPGNLMPFSGVPDAKDRTALIAYLKTLQ